MLIDFEAWHLWVVSGLALAALEMLGLGFVALAIGVGCLAGASAAAMGQPLWIQIAATAVAAGVLTPMFVRWYRNLGGARDKVSVTGDSGSQGEVYVIVSRQERLGVVIKGDFFPAQLAQSSTARLEAGQQVEVRDFSGITALVTIVEKQPQQLG